MEGTKRQRKKRDKWRKKRSERVRLISHIKRWYHSFGI